MPELPEKKERDWLQTFIQVVTCMRAADAVVWLLGSSIGWDAETAASPADRILAAVVAAVQILSQFRR